MGWATPATICVLVSMYCQISTYDALPDQQAEEHTLRSWIGIEPCRHTEPRQR
jgi:hypothetical protein